MFLSRFAPPYSSWRWPVWPPRKPITGPSRERSGSGERSRSQRAVVATNVETGAVYQTLATATGNFTVPSLPAGNYSVSVEAPGFRKYIGQERPRAGRAGGRAWM